MLSDRFCQSARVRRQMIIVCLLSCCAIGCLPNRYVKLRNQFFTAERAKAAVGLSEQPDERTLLLLRRYDLAG